MRTCFSLIAIAVAIAYVEPARADTPAHVYSDFAEDGILSCGHSRSALMGILNDASVYQYGNPLTFLQLKLAIRRQLARGCREARGGNHEGASSETNFPRGTGSTKREAENPKRPRRSALGAQSGNSAIRSEGPEQEGAMVILGAGLLLLALGSGGWAAKRAFTN